MWKLVALLPCLLFISEVRGDCSSLLACENEISNSALVSGDPASLLVYSDESAALDAVCGELSGYTTCVSDNLDTCNSTSVRNQIEKIKDIVEYVCSADGRQVVLDLADSECNDDPILETRIETMMNGCVEDFIMGVQMAQFQAILDGRQFNVSEICPFTDELEVCIVNGSADMCGAAMGTFMTNIWHIASSDQFAQFGCVHDTDRRRRAVKRAVSMILKRAVLLKKLKK
ncbi:hypothetical protein ElyMa_002250800 [Elysia marginata]|uniref:DUF19 domain-containing protein n=1 Tax=Elysia marginata TaxID=1093978 RepID=A0AAV4FXY2_9GAST|nr:hypothetical protein ElyMa_002250800 [Elysia marginata]